MRPMTHASRNLSTIWPAKRGSTRSSQVKRRRAQPAGTIDMSSRFCRRRSRLSASREAWVAAPSISTAMRRSGQAKSSRNTPSLVGNANWRCGSGKPDRRASWRNRVSASLSVGGAPEGRPARTERSAPAPRSRGAAATASARASSETYLLRRADSSARSITAGPTTWPRSRRVRVTEVTRKPST